MGSPVGLEPASDLRGPQRHEHHAPCRGELFDGKSLRPGNPPQEELALVERVQKNTASSGISAAQNVTTVSPALKGSSSPTLSRCSPRTTPVQAVKLRRPTMRRSCRRGGRATVSSAENVRSSVPRVSPS